MAQLPAGYVEIGPGVFAKPKTLAEVFAAEESSNAEARERDLHQKIIDHCDSQWPRWKYIRARMDKRSTIGNGVHDITIFLPAGRVLCIECKAAGRKLEPDQRDWKKEMEMIEHPVHTIWSFEGFLKLL